MRPSILHLLSSILVFTALPARGHDPLGDLPKPISVQEAWDVITQSVRNIGRCIETNQLATVAVHVGNVSPALRVLQDDARARRKDEALVAALEGLFKKGDAVIVATREKADPALKAQLAWEHYDAAVTKVAEAYEPKLVRGGVFVCVHHPLERTTDPTLPCTKCGMKGIRRRIPSSLTYEKPGAPSMKLAARPAAPLKVGEKAEVTVTLTRARDGEPVTRRDLLVMHTEKIHLLIVDSSLTDYHHEHPKPADRPGEYTFSFTPRKPGPYRIFADVVPTETSLQEYVVGEIAADTKGEPVRRAESTNRVEAEGFFFELAFRTKDGGTPKAGEVVTGTLTVKGPDQRGFTKLEPVMGAFAHLVAFHEDGKTVLHIHPEGPEPENADLRGGPTLTFKFYAPEPGYYRLYAQTQIFEGAVFAPFELNVGK